MRQTAIAPVFEAVGTRFSGLEWVDRLKGVAMLWVVLNHITEQLVGGAFAADPTGDWPPLAQRIAQFRPLHGNGLFDWPLTLVRDLGWLADQAVSLFVILSGFGLALGLLAKGSPASIDLGSFYRRRFSRVFPIWWMAHILFLAIAGFLWARIPTDDWQFYASFLGLRFVPAVFNYPMSSWWYVGLIIQLYLIFPFMWRFLRARGAFALFVVSCAAAFGALTLGHAFIGGDVLEMWQRGICCVTRLGEFAFGMALATWWARDRRRVESILRRWDVRAVVALAYVTGIALTFTLPGMVVAPTLLGASALVLLFPLMAWRATGHGFLEVVGRHSFSIYLAHQFFINAFLRSDLRGAAVAVGIGLAIAFAAVGTLSLERVTAASEDAFAALRARHGTRWAAALTAAIVVGAVCVPIVADAAIANATAPREMTLAPSLPPANHSYADWKPSKVLRVLVIGEVFGNSQSIDTQRSWPRYFEHVLAMHGSRSRAEVFQVPVSEYGPDEAAAIVRRFAPLFRPGVVLAPMSAGDIREVFTSREVPRERSAGVAMSVAGVLSVFELTHLHEFVRLRVTKPLQERFATIGLTLSRSSEGVAYGGRGDARQNGQSIRRAASRYRKIDLAARSAAARTTVVFLPSAAEVCARPATVRDASDAESQERPEGDPDAPDHQAGAIAAAAHLTLWDLLSTLRALPECPYDRSGQYLTEKGRRAVAEMLAARITALK